MEYLSEHADTDQPTKMFAQEPSFTYVDTELLRILGITALQCPQGELQISSNTFVLRQHLPRYVLFPSIIQNDVGLYIGNDPIKFLEMDKRILEREPHLVHYAEQSNIDCFIMNQFLADRKVVVERWATTKPFGLRNVDGGTWFAWKDNMEVRGSVE